MIPSYTSPDGNYTRYGLFFDCGYSAGVGSEMYPLSCIAELLVYGLIVLTLYYGVKIIKEKIDL
ncbi:unnamed protein product [marine sediment metagenome]|uniref:Uncharacterized protein n=1 Tax=marine sediment metagenome TaxID=412755 RepID=X1C7U9_9ZZZZ